MRNMDISDIRTFVAVIDAGSVSRAARELYLTQPAVTRRLQRFELAVGTPLIDRSRRPLALTEAGRAAVEQCRRLVSTADELRTLAQGDLVPSREIRVGVAHALTEFALCDPVDQLRRDVPSVVLRLQTGWSRALLERVKVGALDAAVILLPEGESLPGGISGQDLGKEHLEIVAARKTRLRAQHARDLGSASWVLNPEGCAARASLQRALAKVGLPLRVSIETYNYDLQLMLIARERGLGLVPSRLLARSRSRSRLRTVHLRGLEFPLTIWMVTGELAPALAAPIDALARKLTERFADAPAAPHRRRKVSRAARG
jgi:DNA-binding transcriptional LysR family regulator